MKVHRHRRERGFAIYMTTLMLLMIIPMMGLAIDATLLYVVKTRLQGAVDGAALAGAKALSTGTTNTAQTTAATTAAETYVKLNYPSTFFFSADVVLAPSTSSNPGVVINTSVTYQRTVTVTASVSEPTLFMQWFNFMPTTVVATASTIRKDVNIMFVMDRSGSLEQSGSCAPLLADAQAFVSQFSSGNDNVGLVTFASSTILNFAPSTTFDTASPNVSTILGGLSCAGSTSTAYALWTAYQQLIALNETSALNVILLFTDGNPTGAYVNMPVAKTSGCSAYTAGSPGGAGAYTMPSTGKGYLPGLYNVFTVSSWQYFGIIQPTATSITNGDINATTNSTGCAFYAGGAANNSVPDDYCITSDFLGLPTVDVNGNSLTGYESTTGITVGSTSFISLGTGSSSCSVGSPDGMNPFLNAADNAATRIREGSTDAASGKSLSGILIFTIGLGNATVPVDGTFLERVANDPRSPIYNSSYATGTYYYAPTTADLQPAFAAVAAQILRLAK